jgi:hypothetical protein
MKPNPTLPRQRLPALVLIPPPLSVEQSPEPTAGDAGVGPEAE